MTDNPTVGAGEKKGLLDRLSTKARQTMAVLALLFVVGPFVWWLVQDNIRDALQAWIDGGSLPRCVFIPASGHTIDAGKPGEWVTITWRDIERVGDCGAPHLEGRVINGDGIYHDADLSMSGTMLDEGITRELRYQFRIPDNANPGRANFRVTLDFREVSRSINSPRVPFTILEQEEPQP